MNSRTFAFTSLKDLTKERENDWIKDPAKDVFTSTEMSRSEVIESVSSKKEDHLDIFKYPPKQKFESDRNISNYSLSEQKGASVKKMVYPLTTRFGVKSNLFEGITKFNNVNHISNIYPK
jgi:hypothetical protein